MESKADYITQDEVQEALEMLGKGYDHPSIEIEQPREVVERRDGKLVETERPAFVKIYTSFKAEMKDLDEIALKVWLYIALSVNRFTNEAHPGLRTIAEDTGFAVNTVRAAIERLETQYNLLTVERGERKYNRYFPVDYVSARRTDPVSPADTDGKTVSPEDTTVSPKDETVSASVILNQRNQTNQKLGDLVDGYLDLAQSPGIKRAARIDSVLSYLGGKLKINTETKRWKDFAKFVDDRQQTHHEPLDIFVSWLTSQKNFDVQFWPPSKMQEMWPQAFLLETQPNVPQINAAAVEQTKQYNENRWNFTPAPPPPNLTKPVLKTPERRTRR